MNKLIIALATLTLIGCSEAGNQPSATHADEESATHTDEESASHTDEESAAVPDIVAVDIVGVDIAYKVDDV